MSSVTPSPEAIMLPSELERRQIFHWLKRVSSYTAWNRILGYFQAWANIAEASVREAVDKGWITTFDANGKVNGGFLVTRYHPAFTYLEGHDSAGNEIYKTIEAHTDAEYTGTSIGESAYRLILKGLAHMDEGVRRLRLGDKRIFQYNAHGEFVMGTRPSDAWATTLFRIEYDGAAINYEYTPRWDEFKTALETLNDIMGECWPFIIETNDPRDPARVMYHDGLRTRLKGMDFPKPLPDVPDPHNATLVRTGRIIPVSGIWEPVLAPKPKMSLFKAPPPPAGPFPIMGCMNYLHGGSPAPKVSVELEDDCQKIDVTWRLLWRDDRYEDGTIPAEEADYVFQQPQTSTPTPAIETETATPSNVIFGETGQPAPRAGRWLVETDLHANVTLAQGDPLPQHNSRDVRWVWADS